MPNHHDLEGQTVGPLFEAASDWWYNACLNYGLDEWHVYALGYKRAADILVEYVGENQRDQDALVYPIVFCYRQYLELSFKELARDAHDLLESEYTLRRTHRLESLWTELKDLLLEVRDHHGTLLGQEDIDTVTNLVAQFATVDPLSESFRYPEDREGRRTIPGLTHINLRQLKDMIDRLAQVLDGAATTISYYAELRDERRSSI